MLSLSVRSTCRVLRRDTWPERWLAIGGKSTAWGQAMCGDVRGYGNDVCSLTRRPSWLQSGDPMHYFDTGNGNTADSLMFFNTHRPQLGDIVQAQIFAPHHEGPSPYTFVLTDTGGNTLWLSGLAAGYTGEGPRAAQRALLECGFPDRDAEQVLTRSPVRLRRDLQPSAAHTEAPQRLRSRETPPRRRPPAGHDGRER